MGKGYNKINWIIFFLLMCFWAQGQVVFKSGEDGYQTFRIPAIVKAVNGDFLAFCEGRVNGGADFGNIDLVMKTSSDKGKTWSKLSVVVDQDVLQAGNPAPVVDLTDPAYPQGRIFLFYNTGNNHEGENRKGNGLREVWYITSIDHGKTWSEAQNITTQVHKPNYPPQYESEQDWRSYALTPGHAVQAQKGSYLGRIFVAANHSQGEPQDGWKDYRAHGFYTDDYGKTFSLSPSLKYPGSNEATAAFVKDKLIMNVRDQSGISKRRVIAISENGGTSWSQEYIDSALLDPVNEGSLLLLGDNKTLAFSNAFDTKNRNNLTIHLSINAGKTWNKSILVDRTDELQKQRSYSAYSDMVNLSKKSVGVLYEKNNYTEIVFKRINWRRN